MTRTSVSKGHVASPHSASVRYLDADTLYRFLTTDNPTLGRLFSRIEDGDLRAVTSALVFQDLIAVLEHLRAPKDKIAAALTTVTVMRGLEILDDRRNQSKAKEALVRALDYYVVYDVSFTVAWVAVAMELAGVADILSNNPDYDRLPNIRRVPLSAGASRKEVPPR